MADFQAAKRRFYELRCQKAAEGLERRGFQTVVVESREAAVQQILELVPPEATVGVPGSVTIRELELLPRLEQRGNPVIQHWIPGLPKEEGRRLRREELLADVLLTSTNALTLDGQLVNIDGGGNRVAAMIFGPDKVILVVGANKICDDLEAALFRAKKIAAPINALRLNTATPCAKTGYCVDCQTPNSICAVTVIMDKKPGLADITVILVPEELGY